MSRWRRVGNRAIADSVWGIAALIGAVIVLAYLAPKLVKKSREAAREAGGIVGDFEAGRKESAKTK